VSFTCTFEQDIIPKPSTSDDVGGDIGLNDYLAIMGKHTQEKVPNHRCFRKSERNLANKQRIADRKRPGSISHQKAQKAVARIHERIANQRDDILHKLTTRIVANSDNICIETINSKGMLANHRVAKSIADASFSTFSNQIVYKAIGSGNTRIMKAKRFYPSTQICSSCDTPSKDKIIPGVRNWTCSTCGAEHDRDYNAAINLRNLIAKNSGTFEHLPNKGYGALLIVD
jgi:putative transposase